MLSWAEENILLFGKEYIEKINDIKFKRYIQILFQINKKQSVILYNKAIEFLVTSIIRP